MGRKNSRSQSTSSRSISSGSLIDYSSPETQSSTRSSTSSSTSTIDPQSVYTTKYRFVEKIRPYIPMFNGVLLSLLFIGLVCYQCNLEISNAHKSATQWYDHALLVSDQCGDQLVTQNMYLQTVRQSCDLQVSKLIETVCELESLYNSAIQEMVRKLKVSEFVYYNSTICGGPSLPA